MSGGSPGDKRARAMVFPGLFQPGNYFLGRSSCVRVLNRRKKGAQTRARRKRPKITKARAWVQRFRGDMQPELPRTGSRKRKNLQWSRALQRKGTRGRGQARRSECARCRGPAFRLLNEKLTCAVLWCPCGASRRSDRLMPLLLLILSAND